MTGLHPSGWGRRLLRHVRPRSTGAELACAVRCGPQNSALTRVAKRHGMQRIIDLFSRPDRASRPHGCAA
eukprot:4610235-Prymnesium_polylepis.1